MMLKGVNKQVVEITNPESPYFEKVIFFVKPEYVNGDGEKLKKRSTASGKISRKTSALKKNKKRDTLYMYTECALRGRGHSNNVSFKLIHLIYNINPPAAGKDCFK